MADSIRYVVAVAVGVPDRILINAGELPGNLIPASRLLGADRRPAKKIAGDNLRPGKFHRGAHPSADAIQEKSSPHRDQAGRAGRLDFRCHRSNSSVTKLQVLD